MELRRLYIFEYQLLFVMSVFLTKNLEIGLAGDNGNTIDGVLDLIVFAAVEGEHIVVFREGIHEGSCRRNYDVVLAVRVLVEDSVLIEVVGAGGRVALDEPHCERELIGFSRTCCHVLLLSRESRVLLCEKRVVACNLSVLLGDVGIVGVNLVVGVVQCVVVADTDSRPSGVGHYCSCERGSERRAADNVAPVNVAVVDIIVAVVADTVPVAVPVACRKGVNPVAEAMVVMRVIEAVRRPAVEVNVVPVTRMLRAEVVARRLRFAVVVVRTRSVGCIASRMAAVRTAGISAIVVSAPGGTCLRNVTHR